MFCELIGGAQEAELSVHSQLDVPVYSRLALTT